MNFFGIGGLELVVVFLVALLVVDRRGWCRARERRGSI